ncbi:MAG: hypothetical protein KC877_04840 [Candidatus Kaiserbacteria bacterium]|nr:hypothetical protein [Candidatus Kaiserbacteria bacterium]MCB9816892.1 hypothetical protein [Candidatus Nomurabacteria bacterium]
METLTTIPGTDIRVVSLSPLLAQEAGNVDEVRLISLFHDIHHTGVLGFVPMRQGGLFDRTGDPYVDDMFDGNHQSEYVLTITGPDHDPTILLGCRIVYDLLGLPSEWKELVTHELPDDSLEIDRVYVSPNCCQGHADAVCVRAFARGVQKHVLHRQKWDTSNKVRRKALHYGASLINSLLHLVISGLSAFAAGERVISGSVICYELTQTKVGLFARFIEACRAFAPYIIDMEQVNSATRRRYA